MCTLSLYSGATGRNGRTQKISTADGDLTFERKVRIRGPVRSFLAVIIDWTKSRTFRNTVMSGRSSQFRASNWMCQLAVTID